VKSLEHKKLVGFIQWVESPESCCNLKGSAETTPHFSHSEASDGSHVGIVTR